MKKIKYACLILLAVILLSALSACDEAPEGYSEKGGYMVNDNPTALVIILGRHANAMAISDDTYNTIDVGLKKAVYGGYVCVVVSDGEPSKKDLVNSDFFIEDARNTTVLNSTITSRIKELSKLIKDESISASRPENDLLAAIREAKNVLSASHVKDIIDKQIIIVDTGISTTGDFNFVNIDFLRAKPDINEIINQLRDYQGVGVLPDLTGINVTFIGTEDGMAEVAQPQILGTADKRYIKELWGEIVKACGASDVKYEIAAGWNKINLYSDDIESNFPFVSTVTFEYKPVIDMPYIPVIDPNNPDQKPDLPPPPAVDIRLGSEVIGFKPDLAEYLNQANTLRTLTPYVDELREFLDAYPDEKIWLVGTTATTTKGGDGDINLGLRRAEKVRETLVMDFGMQNYSNRLFTIGLGAKHPWHVDEFPKGFFDTEVAQVNRAVWILTNNAETEKFIKLKNAYEKSELAPGAMTRFRDLIDID